MKHLLRVATLAAAVALSACATSGGVPYDPSVAQSLHVGATQAEVVAKLGQPQIKTNNEAGDGGSTWTYAYGTSEQDGRKFIPIIGPSLAKTSSHQQSLTLTFDAKGVLQHIDTREENF